MRVELSSSSNLEERDLYHLPKDCLEEGSSISGPEERDVDHLQEDRRKVLIWEE